MIGDPRILTFGLLTPQGNTFITGTAFEFTIDYGGPAALVLDTVPAEFVVTDVSATNGAAISVSTGKDNPSKSATRIQWEPPDGSNTLTVTIETRESPGKGHKEKVFKPTSCEPLPLNDGATAYLDADGNQMPDVDADGNPITIVGSINSLEAEAVQGDKPCDPDTLTAATVATDCDDGGEITLNWADDNDDIEFYNIFRSDTEGGPYKALSTSLRWMATPLLTYLHRHQSGRRRLLLRDQGGRRGR